MKPVFNVIMAVSWDGFVANGPADSMAWTPHSDKQLFKALTLARPHLYCGHNTFKAMMPCLPLPGRHVIVLPSNFFETPGELAREMNISGDSWLIGGRKTVLHALKNNMVHLLYINRVRVHLKAGLTLAPIDQFFGKKLVSPPVSDLPGLYVYEALPLAEALRLSHERIAAAARHEEEANVH